jgi:hypothetical protein
MAKYKLHKSDQVLINVHSKKVCKGEYCCIHNPSSHHMADWPQVWRRDRAIMERTCEHGVGHPDPDQVMEDDCWVHGCDGCCRPPETNK